MRQAPAHRLRGASPWCPPRARLLPRKAPLEDPRADVPDQRRPASVAAAVERTETRRQEAPRPPSGPGVGDVPPGGRFRSQGLGVGVPPQGQERTGGKEEQPAVPPLSAAFPAPPVQQVQPGREPRQPRNK